MKDCLFCKIIAGEIPSTKIYENDKVYAFSDINPMAPVHVLVVPREHVESLNGISVENAEIAKDCLLACKEIAAEQGLADGYRVVTNCGSDAGQTVKHLHFHVMGGQRLHDRMA